MRVTLWLLAGLVFSAGCSPKYVHEGQISPAFDTRQSYDVAIMPFLVRGLRAPGGFERDIAYDYLARTMMGTGKLMPQDGFAVRDLVKKETFGQMDGIDPVKARALGKKLGADLVCLAELSFEQIEPKVVLIATVKLHSVDSPTILYSGLGRSANPLSLNAAAEGALGLATKKLIEAMR
ncbi:MAG: hypothetical protein R6X12_00785 [bacterium]